MRHLLQLLSAQGRSVLVLARRELHLTADVHKIVLTPSVNAAPNGVTQPPTDNHRRPVDGEARQVVRLVVYIPNLQY